MGNALGAGRAAAARLAAAAAAVSAPLLWAVVAVVLVAPPSQRLLISLFTSGADEVLLERMRHLLYLVVLLEFFDGGQTGRVWDGKTACLLWFARACQLARGWPGACWQGPGGTRFCLLPVHVCCAVPGVAPPPSPPHTQPQPQPRAVLSGVVSGAGKQVHGFLINAVAYWVLAIPAAMSLSFLLKQGVEGLYSGMALGPACQCSCYLLLVWRLRWKEEAETAWRRVQEAGGAG